MREMLCTSTVCPQSVGGFSSWGWNRKTCCEEAHDTQRFLGIFPGLPSGASHTASPQVDRELWE